VQGTFYVPTFNREGRPVMSGAELRSLASGFEIGGHTRDHVPLTTCARDVAEQQVRDNRDFLADLLGREIPGFAYVRGKYDDATRDIVRRLGFRYARTTVNFECKPCSDPFRLSTTIQFFPHPLGTKLRNLVRRGVSRDRVAVMAASLGTSALSGACRECALAAASRGRFFHLWGHSWELDEFELWGEFEALLASLRQIGARQVSNGALVAQLTGEAAMALHAPEEI
jgi:peptidoglycan-N-acetylglucosamine deacetylase